MSDSTVTTIISNLNPAPSGEIVSFLITVVDVNSPPGIPTGTITLTDGLNPLASDIPLNNGVAEFSTGSFIPGSHSITASYIATGIFLDSVGTLNPPQVITPGGENGVLGGFAVIATYFPTGI
jgi:Bacterial Ig-like domain (group 3)